MTARITCPVRTRTALPVPDPGICIALGVGVVGVILAWFGQVGWGTVGWLAGLAGVAGLSWSWYRNSRDAYVVLARGDDAEVAWRNPSLAVDPEVGHRGARNVIAKFRMGRLDSMRTEAIRRLSNDHGCIAERDFGEDVSRPRIALLGDSHTMGIVSTADNVGPELERRLRERTGLADATVMNASASYYTVYQYLLRARQLLPRYRPEALVVVLFVGNDLLNLEDVGRPHLSDDLAELPASDDPPPETTSARLAALELPEGVTQVFYQGLNQIAYLRERPERRAPILRKADYALRELAALAQTHGTHLLVAVLPTFDLVFPDRAEAAGPKTVELVATGIQQRMHASVLELLRKNAIDHIDLLPVYRDIGTLDLFAQDFHIWKRGHVAIAEAVVDRLATVLGQADGAGRSINPGSREVSTSFKSSASCPPS